MHRNHMIRRLLTILIAVVLITAPISTALAAGYDMTAKKPVGDNGKKDKSVKDKSSGHSKNNHDKNKQNQNKQFENPRDALNDALRTLQPSSTPPLYLKQEAHDEISSIVHTDKKNNKDILKKLDSTESHISTSIESEAWLDPSHLKPIGFSVDTEIDDNNEKSRSKTIVFKEERSAIQDIITIISKNKEKTFDNSQLIDAVVHLVQADQSLARISIQDAQRAASFQGFYTPEELARLEKNIEKAQKEFDKANEQIAKGEPINAIRHFEKAWEYTTSDIVAMDAATPPVIVFDSINNNYINTTHIALSGHVEDVAVYTIPDITLSVNDASSVLGLTNGCFDTDLVLKEGENNINATVTDLFGNVGTRDANLIVDLTPPVISVEGVEDGSYYNSTVSFLANMTDEHLDTLTIRVNGNPYKSGTPIIAEGTYAVDITARDLAGNTAHLSFTFHIDMTVPVITINEPDNGSFISGTVPFNTTITDASPVTISVMVDGMPVDMTSLDSTVYPDGPHAIMVHALDAAGNGAEESITLFVDNTPPEVLILEPADNEAIRQIRQVLADVYDQYLDSITLFINDEEVSYNDHHTFNTSDYLDGLYTISAEAVDLANNTGFDNISVLVDNTPPVVSVTSPLDGVFVKGTVAINADILEANTASVYVTVDGILISETLPFEWDTSLYPDGDHTISVYVTDTAGNDVADSVSVVVDNTPPTVVITLPVYGSAIRDVVSITSRVYDSYI